MSNLVEHAKYELQRAGLLDDDSDYDGMLGKAALEIVEVFAKQGHSGYSAMMTIDIVTKLMSYQPLTDITSDPEEWTFVAEDKGGPIYQSKRRSSSFSRDGGKTWYDIDDPERNNGDTWKRVDWVDYELGDERVKPGHVMRVKSDAYSAGSGLKVNGKTGTFAGARNGYVYIRYDGDNQTAGAPHRPWQVEAEAF